MMNAEDVAIECSWVVENVDDICNKILWRDQSCELTEESGAENCFVINAPVTTAAASVEENNTPCILKLKLKNNRKFSVLQLLSEVPMVEVCGEFEEYLLTVKGDLLDDDVEGSSLYECRIEPRKLQSELHLKFCKMQNKSHLWIYGIAAVTKLAPGGASKFPVLGGPASGPNAISALMAGLKQGDGLPTGMGSSSFAHFEQLVDAKVKQMEERILSRIGERFDRLEKAMDDNQAKLVSLLADGKK